MSDKQTEHREFSVSVEYDAMLAAHFKHLDELIFGLKRKKG